MFILYFALWVVLNGRWTAEIGVFGLIFAALAYVFTWRCMGFGPKVDLALLRRAPSAIAYGVTLLGEIVKANLSVVRMILDGEKEPQPQLVQFDVDLKKNRHLVALANSITLTPGTITVDLHDNHFTVHALDASMVEGLDDGVFVQKLMRMEEKHMAQEEKQTEDVSCEAADEQDAPVCADADICNQADEAQGSEEATAEEKTAEEEKEA